jgi:hypothetical protein
MLSSLLLKAEERRTTGDPVTNERGGQPTITTKKDSRIATTVATLPNQNNPFSDRFEGSGQDDYPGGEARADHKLLDELDAHLKAHKRELEELEYSIELAAHLEESLVQSNQELNSSGKSLNDCLPNISTSPLLQVIPPSPTKTDDSNDATDSKSSRDYPSHSLTRCNLPRMKNGRVSSMKSEA